MFHILPSPFLMADNNISVDTKIVSQERSSEISPILSKRKSSLPLDPVPKRACQKGDENTKPTFPDVAKNSPDSAATSSTVKPREASRKNSIIDDKKRGQRLFGSFLSVINQNVPSKQQKRRIEIEKRQVERAKLQKVQDEVKKASKLSELLAIRKIEQIKHEEETMRIRHASMLAMANFLCTKSEPKLYYKPWELLPEQEDCIKSQIATVSAKIEKEVAEFNKRHDRESKEVKNPGSSETVGEPHTELPSSNTNTNDTTNPTDPSTVDEKTEERENKVVDKGEDRIVSTEVEEKKNKEATEEVEKDAKGKDKDKERDEHNGEVMVVNEEDTVIY